MTRILSLLAAGIALAALAALATLKRDSVATATKPPEMVLHVGDRVRVDGEPIGCRVAHKHGAVVIDCRRAGPLKGTYGTMLDARRVDVVRFRSNRVAKIVFTAVHRGEAHRCR